MVSSTSLKRLSICFTYMDYANDYEVVIDAPKVEYLYLSSKPKFVNYSLMKQLPLVEVYVSTSYYNSIAHELVTSISRAKMMTLAGEIAWALSSKNLDMPIFPSLVKLIIHIEKWDFLLKLLKNMPNLEHITFLDGLPYCKRYYWQYETAEPKHSINLEKLRINAHGIRPKRAEKLLTLYHASNLCRIKFMWGSKRWIRRRWKPCGARAFGALQQVKLRGNG
ncbi:hypothetical protein Tco_1510211 [Tanacetum coccineum]